MPKSIILKKNGGPEVLELQDVKVGSPGPDEIKVTNHAIGLNYIDTYHRSGLYKLNLPSGIGMEGSGTVMEIGSDVKYFRKGDRVTYSQMPLGSYSEERIIPETIAVKIPEGVSDKVAASIMTKGLTSHYLLFKTYKVKAGELILFHAAAGGVGQIFCQWAKSLGCKIIGTVGQLQYEVIQYRLEHEYNAKCRYEPINLYKACWFTSENEEQLQDFKMRKLHNLAKDKEGRDVFLADSRYALELAQEKYSDIEFHFKSEF